MDRMRIRTLSERSGLRLMQASSLPGHANHWIEQESPRLLITARPLREYPLNVRTMDIERDTRYGEIGPGLGGFARHVVENGGEYVAIEPADLEGIAELLRSGMDRADHPDVRMKLARMHDDCELLLSDRVRLIDATLQEAARDPANHGSLDVFVDMYATAKHRGRATDSSESVQDIADQAKILLRPGGTYLYYAGRRTPQVE